MRFGSVCSGIEAASVAFAPLGWKAAWLAEIEPFPAAVLAHHYPEVPNLGDMTAIPRRLLAGEIEAPDMLCGGTPCQAFSIAGLRESLSDERGNLTLKFVEIADAIDHVRARRCESPAIVLWENVPGVLSTKDNAFGCFLAGLAGEDEPLQPPGEKWANAGCVYGPARAVAWRTLDAQYFGLAQRRRRVFVVASARDGFDPAQVLFEWDGVRRDSPPSRGSREGSAARTVRSVALRGRDGGATAELGDDLAGCLRASGGGGDKAHALAPYVAHTLRGEGFDASEDGTGRGTPLVPVAFAIQAGALRTNPLSGPDGIGVQADHAYTLEARAEVQAVCFDTTQITSATNRSNPRPGDPCHPLAVGAHAPAIAFSCKDYGGDAAEEVTPTLRAMNHAGSHANAGGQMAVCVTGDITHTLRAEGFDASEDGTGRGNPIVAGPMTACGGTEKKHGFGWGQQDWESGYCQPTPTMQVRRLTPEECEALQGFPRGYTKIPWRNKPASECPDGPRYKALGNSWPVPCVRWIGRRIEFVKGLA